MPGTYRDKTPGCSAFVIEETERYWGKILNQEGYLKRPFKMLQLNQKIYICQNTMHPNIVCVFLAQDNQTKTPGKMYRMMKAGGGKHRNRRKKMKLMQETSYQQPC